MKRILCLLLACCLLAFSFTGCSAPNSLTLDLSRGYGDHLKLLHLNAATDAGKERILAFGSVFTGGEATDRVLKAYESPDYLLEIHGASLTEDGFVLTEGGSLRVYVDINGTALDFFFPDAQDTVIYRAKVDAEYFKRLINQV